MRVMGIAGSLRQSSYNRALLAAAVELAPEGMTIEPYEGLADIPMYNGDLDTDELRPASVVDLKRRIAEADALFIVSPEYNYSVPGVLKNAIDWASRPPEQPFDGKPIAILGVAPGAIGTARAQYHLRQVFVYLNGMVLNRPEVMIGQGPSRFDAEGRLTDAKTREFVAAQLLALRDWTERLRR